MKRLPTYLAAAFFSMAFSAASAGDLETIIQDCNGCHGDNGVSQWAEVPTIAGLPEFQHADALYIYQDEARPCRDAEYKQGDTSRAAISMCAVAAKLSEDEIDAIAAAYAELPYVKAKQEFDADLAAAGKALHDEHCDKCHSDEGTNPEDEAGMLGGQLMGYLKQSFVDYKADTRDQPKKMKEKIDMLSDDDVTALVHYYGSVQ